MSRIVLITASCLVLVFVCVYSYSGKGKNSLGSVFFGPTRLDMNFSEVSAIYPNSDEIEKHVVLDQNNNPILISVSQKSGHFAEKESIGFLDNKVVGIYKSEHLTLEEFQNKIKEYSSMYGEPLLEPPSQLISTRLFSGKADSMQGNLLDERSEEGFSPKNSVKGMTPIGKTISENAVFWEHKASSAVLMAGFDKGFAYFWLIQVDKYDEHERLVEEATEKALNEIFQKYANGL